MLIKKIINTLKNPCRIITFLNKRNMANWMPDIIYLKAAYRVRFNKKLNLKNPQTFNEKIQWLKLYDRNPLYTKLVDKYDVREYIADTIGEEYLIPLLGVWDKFDDIDFSKLPEQFVLKCTHDSKSVIICKDKSSFNIKDAKTKINDYLNKNFYWLNREWQYKDVPPRIIAEKYMEDETGELRDYKFFCFGGEVKFIQVDFERFNNHKQILYTTDWNPMRAFTKYLPSSEVIIKQPENLEKMLEIANKISKGIPFVRIDLYYCSPPPEILFGEFTLHPGAGFKEFEPKEFEYEMGSWITLPKIKNTKII